MNKPSIPADLPPPPALPLQHDLPTRQELAAIGGVLKAWRACLPPVESRNVTKNGAMQPAFNQLRAARSGLAKMRAIIKGLT